MYFREALWQTLRRGGRGVVSTLKDCIRIQLIESERSQGLTSSNAPSLPTTRATTKKGGADGMIE